VADVLLDAHDYAIGDDVLYRVRDDLWLPCKVVNITRRRIVIRPHQKHAATRNTTASQLRHVPKEAKA
jgi:hypothetical protein